MLSELKDVIMKYLNSIRKNLGSDYIYAVVYGSLARNEADSESDIDIAIFTDVLPEEFYKLVDKIAETTFEFSVMYDVILSPVFINQNQYNRMLNVMPFYQSIQRDGVIFG